MSELHFGWANLPCPMEGFEIADGEDGLAYVYGQGGDAKAIVTRIVNALQGTSELTALRQQVADLRAAADTLSDALMRDWNRSTKESSQRVVATWKRLTAVLAATQPQEVQS